MSEGTKVTGTSQDPPPAIDPGLKQAGRSTMTKEEEEPEPSITASSMTSGDVPLLVTVIDLATGAEDNGAT